MQVSQLWRYPVKSMRGETLRAARVERDGIRGDRAMQVRGPDGLVTARTAPRLLALSATLGADDRPLVDGRPHDDPDTARAVAEAAGAGARLVASAPEARFDETPLLVATDGAIATLGRDGRRLRPNLVVAGVEGLAERGWPGQRLRAGEAVIALEHLCERCVITTIDPDTLERDAEVLRDIRNRFGARIALNCTVVRPGSVRVGDPVELL